MIKALRVTSSGASALIAGFWHLPAALPGPPRERRGEQAYAAGKLATTGVRAVISGEPPEERRETAH